MSTPGPGSQPPSPQEREARIAQLRARRKARLRTLAVRSAIASGALLVLVCIGLYWLLQTVAGREVLLAQIVARLPAGSTFTWTSAEGPVAGPLTLRGVHFHMDGIDFTAERIYLEPDLRPLLGRRLRLDRLEVDNAVLDIPPSTTPFELPSWPEVMPAIRMPLSIQADALTLDRFRFAQAGTPVITIHQASGGVDIGDGYVFADTLAVRTDRGNLTVNGDYEPRNGYRTDMTVSAGFPAARGRTPAALGLVARGDRSHMQVAIGGRAPAPLQVQLDVRGTSNPDWGLRAQTHALDLSLLGLAAEGTPALDLSLQANGTRGGAAISGKLVQDGNTYVVEPSHLRIDGKVLHVAPLAVQLLDGRVSLRGYADFTQTEDPQFKFAVNARGLRWGAAGPEQIAGDADLGVAGRLKQWAAIGKAEVTRDAHRASVAFDARGSDTGADLKTLRATTPGGTLDLAGHLDWAPRLAWDVSGALDRFDPGDFAPGWNGSLSGKLASRGRQRDAAAGQGTGFDASLDLPDLRGTLRGRPLEAKATLALAGNTGQGQVALSLGSSHVQAQGSVGDTLDVDARLTPLVLSDLLSDATGRLAGSLHLSGPRATPTLQADLSGDGLKYGDYTADAVTLRGRLPWQGSDGALELHGQAVQAGLLLDSVQVQARGAVTDLQLQAQARNAMASLDLAGHARQQGTGWQGGLQALRIVPAKGDAWALRAPAQFTQRGQAFTLSESCLAASSGPSLCVAADWPNGGLTAHSDGLPLSLVQPWLPPNEGRPLSLRGTVTLQADLRPAGNAWAGQVHLASKEGGLRMGTSARGEIMRYDQFSLDVAMTPQSIQGRLGTGFAGDGYVDAKFDTGWDAYAPLKGDVYFFNARLFWLELFSPDLVRPRGKLTGHLGLAGTRGTPLLSGEAQLTDFTGQLPALGIDLVDGSASLVALSDGTATLTGTLKSASTTGNTQAANGKGTLSIEGSLGWQDTSAPLRFNVTGQDFLASDTRKLRLVVAPQIQVQLQNNIMAVTGNVQVPSANIDIESFTEGVSPSEDVVVLDPADPEAGTPSRLSLDLGVGLGNDVHLKGLGLEGSLTGQMHVRSRPGQSMAATGQLDVDGRYTAYGQKLQITRGELSWSNDDVTNPSINLRAEREVISYGVTAGIDVTGRASAPRAQVWSNPETSESDALAYLVLGRPLSQANSQESAQVDAAQSALSAGAGLIASQLGAKIGLDDAGMLESRTLGASVFGVGKYLSPRLYVSYGVSMVGSGAVVTLRYLIRKGFNAEIESSSVETRGSLNWRKEK